jgi:hypothetical protein
MSLENSELQGDPKQDWQLLLMMAITTEVLGFKRNQAS